MRARPSARRPADILGLAAGALPPAARHAVVEAVGNSVHVVFVAAIPVALAAFLAVLVLRERPLRESAHIGGG